MAVRMTFGNNAAVCRKFYLVSAFGYDTVSGFYSWKDLYFFPVIDSESNFLFFVSFFIELEIYEITSLLFGEGCYRNSYYIIYISG